MEGKNIMNHITAQRLKWFRHIERREKHTIIRKIKDWRPIGDKREQN